MKSRRVYVDFNNLKSMGYIIKKSNNESYWVFIESLNLTIEIERKHIHGLDLVFR
jgi:hypothetical protein